MREWVRAVGFYRGFLLVSFIPVSLGTALAWRLTGAFDLWLFLLAMISVWFFHAGTNLLNDYYDHISGTDDINEVRTPFSGGTRVIQEGLLSPGQIMIAGYGAFAVGSLFFIWLAALVGWPILALACFGFLSGWSYSARPVWLAYRGWGELLIGLNFGPALVLTGYFTQARHFSGPAFLTGLIIGCWGAAIITANEIPDFTADEAVGKKNLVVRWGMARGLRIWAGLLYAGVGLLIGGVFLGWLPREMVLGVLVLPLLIRLVQRSHLGLLELDETVATCAGTIKSEVFLWLLLMGGLLVGHFWGAAA